MRVLCGAIALAAFIVLVDVAEVNGQVPEAPSWPGNRIPTPGKPPKTASPRRPCTLPSISAQNFQEIVDASSVLQPPLASDAMIRVAAKVASQCPSLAKDFLQRAFDQTGAVEPEMEFKLASRDGIATDSRLYFEHQTYALHLDRLSLQSRAVLAMVTLDAEQAIQLFERIAPPRPPAVTCTKVFAPDVSIYYQAAGQVLELRKREKPRNDAEAQAPFLQLQEVAGATTSPVQLLPLAELLEKADPSPNELSSLLSTLAAAVERFPIDDNSFSLSGEHLAVKAKRQLEQLADKKQVSPGTFRHSFHDYLNRSLNGPHCNGNVPKDLKELVSLYESFNRGPSAFGAGIELLSAPTSTPTIESPPDTGEYWQSPKTKELLIDAKHLNFDDNWQPFTDVDRKTPEWQDRVRHMLNDIENWGPMDESDPASYLHQRCILFYETLAYLPPGPLYDRITALWMDTLADSSLQWDNPAEWDLEVSHFLRFSRKPGSTETTPLAALAALRSSSNSYLHALGVLSEFLK